MRSWHRLINDFQDSKIIFFWPAILSRNSTAKSNLLGVGPQVFLENRTKTKSNHETIAFLDRALEVAGKHSVIYVAFGTMGTPGRASKIGFLFDALETSGLWVLFSHAWGEEERAIRGEGDDGVLGTAVRGSGTSCRSIPLEKELRSGCILVLHAWRS